MTTNEITFSIATQNKHCTMMNTDDTLDEEAHGVSQAMANAGVSVPDAEELKTGVPLTTQRCSSRVWTVLCACSLVLAIVLGVAIGGRHSESGGTNRGILPSFTKFAKKPGRNADLTSVLIFLNDESVSDMNDLTDTATPQFQAAAWLADEDEANFAVPANDDPKSYLYIFRYVMALNYFALGGAGWTGGQMNFLSGMDVCDWNGMEQDGSAALDHFAPGVICNQDTMLPKGVYLAASNLQGRIPTENGLLVSLSTLDLELNSLTGSIPDELCSLQNLQGLYLNDNILTGDIPKCVDQWADLKRLFLGHNALQGSLPETMASLVGLQMLIIDDNMLSGDPVAVFNSLPSLTQLIGNDNKFTGQFDDSFLSQHDRLTWVDPSGNGFTGFPSQLLVNPKQLQIFDLSRNQLSGALPSDIPENSIFEFLSLYSNALSGPLPSQLRNFKSLNHLDVSDNEFVGPIPADLGQLTLLEILFLSANGFDSDVIPESFAGLENLKELSLRSTNRIGALPDWIADFKNLRLFDVGSNTITGAVPETFIRLENLQHLFLNNNTGISGELPDAFGAKLRSVFLDGTSLSGNVQTLLCGSTEERVIYADCGGSDSTVDCTCCKCCDPSISDDGCSLPYMAHVEADWETNFQRTTFNVTDGACFFLH